MIRTSKITWLFLVDSPLCVIAYWREQSGKNRGDGLSGLSNHTGWKPHSSDISRKCVLPGVSGDVIPTFPVEDEASCREECRVMRPKKQPTGRCTLQSPRSWTSSLTTRLLWKRPDLGVFTSKNDHRCWRWLSVTTSSWGAPGVSCAALVRGFFKREQSDMHCSLDLDRWGKHVQHRNRGDAYREAGSWDRCA